MNWLKEDILDDHSIVLMKRATKTAILFLLLAVAIFFFLPEASLAIATGTVIIWGCFAVCLYLLHG